MATTYDFLRTATQKLRQEHNRHPLFLFIVLLLACVPLPYQFNSIALLLFSAVTLITLKKGSVRFDLALLLPVMLYALMAASLLWTIDMEESAPSISKELPLVVIPVCFMLFAQVPMDVRKKAVRWFSFAIVGYCVFYLIRAALTYFATGNADVFFYHGLVTKDVNAIHVSVYVSIAFFSFLTKNGKTAIDKASIAVLFVTLILLSSKNIIAVFLLLIAVYYLFYSGLPTKIRTVSLVAFAILLLSLAAVPQIRERFMIELETATTDNTINNSIGEGNVRNISVRQAWSSNDFTPNDFFPGTAFRVYQFRIFLELMAEDKVWLQGYGLNASYDKIEKKTLSYNLFSGNDKVQGYQKKNFHNQYIQNFADLGVFGFLLLLAMLGLNLKNGLKRKDFVHISFAVLMISLFLTESFLWRQRGVTFFTMMYCLLNAGIRRKE